MTRCSIQTSFRRMKSCGISRALCYQMVALDILPSVLLNSLGEYITPEETEAVRRTSRALRSLKCRQFEWSKGSHSLIDKDFVREAHFSTDGKVQRGFPKLTSISLHQGAGLTCSPHRIHRIHEWMTAYPSCRFRLTFFGIPARLDHLNLSCIIDLRLTSQEQEQDSLMSLTALAVLESLNSLTLFSVRLSALVRDVTPESRPLSVKSVILRNCFEVREASGFWVLLPFLQALEYRADLPPICMPMDIRSRLLTLTIPPCELSPDYSCLRSLHVVYVLDEERQIVLEHLRNLVHLTVVVSGDFVARLPGLLSLQLACTHRTSRVFVHASSQLQMLRVRYSGWCDFSLQDDFATAFPALTELSVSNREKSEMSVHILPPRLQTLCLTQVGLACLGAWQPRTLRNFCYIDAPFGLEQVRAHLSHIFVNRFASSRQHEEHNGVARESNNIR